MAAATPHGAFKNNYNHLNYYYNNNNNNNINNNNINNNNIYNTTITLFNISTKNLNTIKHLPPQTPPATLSITCLSALPPASKGITWCIVYHRASHTLIPSSSPYYKDPSLLFRGTPLPSPSSPQRPPHPYQQDLALWTWVGKESSPLFLLPVSSFPPVRYAPTSTMACLLGVVCVTTHSHPQQLHPTQRAPLTLTLNKKNNTMITITTTITTITNNY